MKHFLLVNFILWLAAALKPVYGQSLKDSSTMLLRISEDNDFINFYMKGTDNAYTNGTRIDFFYLKNARPHFFVDRILPKAGANSINVYGWGLTQLMYTPNDIATTDYQPNDYPYAGALYTTHSLYSYNVEKKYDFQTEIELGVRGPAAFTKQTQTFVHRLINYQSPMGWAHQARNAAIVNVNFSVEKLLASYGGWLELISGVQGSAGSLYNALDIYQELRVGKMSAYFNGLISQYSTTRSTRHSIQAYLFAKSQPVLVFSDPLLQAKVRTNDAKIIINPDAADKPVQLYHDINRLVYYFTYGGVISSGHFSISLSQSSNTALLKDLYSHEYGNISLYFSW